VSGTAATLAQALNMGIDERESRSDSLRRAVLARTPSDWLNDQLEALN
jgi:trehalose-6-phosphate synthase